MIKSSLCWLSLFATAPFLIHAQPEVTVWVGSLVAGVSTASFQDACSNTPLHGQTVDGTPLVCLASSSVKSVLWDHLIVTPLANGSNAQVGLANTIFSSGQLDHEILLADGTQPTSSFIWTGCDVSGETSPDNCYNFAGQSGLGVIGGANTLTSDWITLGSAGCTNTGYYIYCYLLSTSSPSTSSPTTSAPSTTSPTTTSPTTASPTTSSPTTTSPSTIAPTTTSPSTMGPTTTGSPTGNPTSSPTTSAPTMSPSSVSPTSSPNSMSPSSSPATKSPTQSPSSASPLTEMPSTSAPTNTPTTAYPTITIGVVTPSPTTTAMIDDENDGNNNTAVSGVTSQGMCWPKTMIMSLFFFCLSLVFSLL